MSDQTEVPPQQAMSLLDRAVAGLNGIGSLWVMMLVLFICLDSFGRSLFNRPFDGVNEVVAVSMALIVFCQLADTVRLNKLTRSDTFLPILESSPKFISRLIVIGFDVLGIIVMVCIIVGTTPRLIESIERGYYVGEAGLFTFPDWPVKAMVVLGSLVTALCLLVRAIAHWRRSSGGPVNHSNDF